MRDVIRDRTVNHQLDRTGVALFDLCSPAVIDQLKCAFNKLHPSLTESMRNAYYVSVYGTGEHYYTDVHRAFINILSPILEQHFIDYKVPIAVAQVKGIGTESSVNLHQDLTIVDETQYRSYVLWIPLERSTVENGTLSFLERSHTPFRNVRMHTADYLFEEAEDYIIEHSTVFSTEPGQALLFDPATIHFSGPNHSTKPRRSIALEITDKDAPLILCHRPDKRTNEVNVYEVPDDFWFHYDDFKSERTLPPSFGNLVRTEKNVRIRPYSRTEFIDRYEQFQ